MDITTVRPLAKTVLALGLAACGWWGQPLAAYDSGGCGSPDQSGVCALKACTDNCTPDGTYICCCVGTGQAGCWCQGVAQSTCSGS